MKLGTLLLRNAAISLSQLEAALRGQVLYGGRLGTNLVELGFLDLDSLGLYLGELTGLPVATPELLETVTKPVLDAVGAQLADLYGVVPLGYIGEALAIAMIEPHDAAAIGAISQRTGRTLAPYVVAELRLLFYLEKYYGLARKARFIRAGTRRLLSVADDRRRSQPPAGLAMPPGVVVEPRRRRTEPPAYPLLGHVATPPLSYPTACDRIDHASHRDQIANILVEYSAGRFSAMVVFFVRDGNAIGWRGAVAGRGEVKVDHLSLPLGGTSSLEVAYDSLRPFRGPPPSSARPIETLLWTGLEVPPPSHVLVTPILVKQRVVNLVYAHAGGTLPELWSDELCELAVRASAAYRRLIQETKDQPA